MKQNFVLTLMCGILFCIEHATQTEDSVEWEQVFSDLKVANGARGWLAVFLSIERSLTL